MRCSRQVFDALADLLTYPGDVDWPARRRAIELVSQCCPDAAAPLGRHEALLAVLSEGEREELFTRTFDNTNERSLEIGWQLFGENYARGALMVRLRGLLREHGVPESSELPDHMTHVLRLLGHAPAALARALMSGQAAQALEKLLEGCRAFESPYCGVLEAIQVVFAQQLESMSEPLREPLPESVTR